MSMASLPAARVLEVDSSEMIELAREVIGAGASVWIRARGISMTPVIPSDTPVRVAPVRERPAPGDILLVCGVAGRPLIHRVSRVNAGPQGDRLVLRGDSHLVEDPPIDATRVIGRVDCLLVDGREVPLSSRWPHRIIADVRRTGRRALARARTWVR